MAEELIIRVKIDGMGDTNTSSSSSGGGARGSDGLLTGAVIGANLNRNRALELGNKASNLVAKAESKYVGPANITGAQADLSSIREIKKGRYRSTYSVGMLDPEALKEGYKSYFGDAEVGVFNKETLIKDAKVAGTAAAWKATSVAVSMTQMRSGDSYYNETLNNNVKLAGYGAALAMSGPAAPLMLVGIVANEAVTAFTDSAKYNYNRELEQNQISNMKALAGDVSYGRRGGKL